MLNASNNEHDFDQTNDSDADSGNEQDDSDDDNDRSNDGSGEVLLRESYLVSFPPLTYMLEIQRVCSPNFMSWKRSQSPVRVGTMSTIATTRGIKCA